MKYNKIELNKYIAMKQLAITKQFFKPEDSFVVS